MEVRNNNKIISFVLTGLFVLTGTYNAVVINSESHISSDNVKFVKRLDEVYGVTIAGREVAASANWQKLSVPEKTQKLRIKEKVIAKAQKPTVEKSSVDLDPVAAVQEELSLSLVEVINPTKWKNGLTSDQFQGYLATNQGVIETLNISLPNNEGISVSFSEMVGNVFEYELDGEIYPGMMYQVDQNAYMVTLTSGPLEGTRLRFSSQTPEQDQEQTAQYLADNNIEVGTFGAPVEQQILAEANIDIDQQMQAQGFDLDQGQTL